MNGTTRQISSITYILQCGDALQRAGMCDFEQCTAIFNGGSRIVMVGPTPQHHKLPAGKVLIQRTGTYTTMVIDCPTDFCFYKVDLSPAKKFIYNCEAYVDQFNNCRIISRENETFEKGAGIINTIITPSSLNTTITFYESYSPPRDILKEALMCADVKEDLLDIQTPSETSFSVKSYTPSEESGKKIKMKRLSLNSPAINTKTFSFDSNGLLSYEAEDFNYKVYVLNSNLSNHSLEN